MKIRIEQVAGAYVLTFNQGVQYFTLGYRGGKKEVAWMAKMLRKAFKAHDKEKLAAYLKKKKR